MTEVQRFSIADPFWFDPSVPHLLSLPLANELEEIFSESQSPHEYPSEQIEDPGLPVFFAPVKVEPVLLERTEATETYGYAKWDRCTKRLVDVNNAFARLVDLTAAEMLLNSSFTWEQLGLTSRLTDRADNENAGHDPKYEVAISFFKLQKAHEKLRQGLATTFRFKIIFVSFSGKAQYVRMTLMGTETKDVWVVEEVSIYFLVTILPSCSSAFPPVSGRLAETIPYLLTDSPRCTSLRDGHDGAGRSQIEE